MDKSIVIGPSYEEMLHPWKIDEKIRKRALEMKDKDPLHPINLYNINWRDAEDRIYHFVLPPELTGVKANIVVMYAKDFPSGSHKVGPTYSVLMEKAITGAVDPSKNQLIWPSTGNYGIGGAWVSSRMKYDSIVLLPEEMSAERFEIIESYGGHVIKTPGCESNVKEIYDKSKALKAENPEVVKVLNQFEAFGNYRFHEYVTGNTMVELVNEEEIGNKGIAAVALTVGSAGTIASGDRVKKYFPNAKIVAGEPIQCPTLSLNGYGGHDIQGIGDKHVTWIHNVMNNDAVVQIDDMDCKKMLQVISSDVGKDYLKEFVNPELIEFISDKLGISCIANIIAAIKTAKYYDLQPGENVLTVATDSIERYHSVMDDMTETFGELTRDMAMKRYERIFKYQEPSYFFEGTVENRNRWHNLKYYTWVEQQGKTVEELNLQKTQIYWEEKADEVEMIDRMINKYKKENKEALDKIIGV